jgi:hypothetical protein
MLFTRTFIPKIFSYLQKGESNSVPMGYII